MKFIIKIQSLIDVITNSSSELFIIDKNKGLDFVEEIVNQAIKKYPSKFGDRPNVTIENPEYYDGSYGCFNVEDAIDKLNKRGYKIIAPESPVEPEAIIISWERGYMSEEFINYISEIFNVKLQEL